MILIGKPIVTGGTPHLWKLWIPTYGVVNVRLQLHGESPPFLLKEWESKNGIRKGKIHRNWKLSYLKLKVETFQLFSTSENFVFNFWWARLHRPSRSAEEATRMQGWKAPAHGPLLWGRVMLLCCGANLELNLVLLIELVFFLKTYFWLAPMVALGIIQNVATSVDICRHH